MKLNLTREFYIPTGALKVAHKKSSAVAYLYTNRRGKPAAVMFQGKAAKPAQQFYYADEARRERAVTLFFQGIQGREEAVRQRRVADKAPHSLETGMILVAQWGYSMSLVDFYEVVATTAGGVTLEEIGSTTVSGTAGYSGTVVADASVRKGKFFKVRANHENRVKISDSSRARVWNGAPCYFNQMD